MKFQTNTVPQELPSPNFTVLETGEIYTSINEGLIAVPASIIRVLNIDSSNASNTQNSLNLIPDQIAAISNEIKEKLFFGSSLVPLLNALKYADKTPRDKDGNIIEKNVMLAVNEYEIFPVKAQKGPNVGKEVSVIRMPNLKGENTDMANTVIAAIRSLFPDQVLDFSLKALNKSVDQNGIYPGYRRGDNGESDDVGEIAYSWRGGDGNAVNAPYEGRFHHGSSDSGVCNRQNALCLVASFG